ncbi:NADPH2:quinone reductase [Ophiocordyceps camponoti-floridani]|uniref:NADPH2:quinone reductase n=1 Tax=Ophiocordyceps camponoti-floridani TaxID=2030778 RepID=A0A8H4QB14_9HYPO|nr:NADPH2:quinone reductase [Ophiocordyceps camponoti-floridani]
MRAIVINKYVEKASDLTVTTAPDPTPNNEEYTIRIHAAAANFFDILQIQGRYQTQPPFPWVAGVEFAGTVLSVPTSSSPPPTFKVGDRVFGGTQGAFATRVCAGAGTIRAVPEGWTFSDAAGLFVTAPTSYAALVTRAGVKEGDVVLVHAAAGGVGLAAVQVAKAFGATVIATASSADKLAVARSYGADHVISYTSSDWPSRVKELTAGKRGVDIVFDPVGLVDASTKCTAWNGRILIVGFAAGAIEKVPVNKVLLKNIALVGIFWGAYAVNQPEVVPQVWDGVMRLISEGKLRPTVYHDDSGRGGGGFHGLDSVKDALSALASRRTWGKVVINIPHHETSRL